MTEGISYLFRGFKMLKEDGVRRYVAGPLTINIALFASLISYATNQFNYWSDHLLAQIPGWLNFLEFVLWPLFLIVMLIVVIFSFTILVNIIGAPFNALLAERVAERTKGAAPQSANAGWGDVAASVPRSLVREFARLAYTLPLALLIWLFTLIPGLNIFAPALWFLWGAWMMSIQYTDYAADNERIQFSQLRSTLSANRLLTLSFGAGVTLMTMVPILNLFVMPAAVCGATLLWCERLEPKAQHRE